MTERTPEECTVNDTWTGQASRLLGSYFGENHVNDVSRSPDSSAHLPHQSPCKGNSIVEDSESIEQVERGVFITLFHSPAGHKYLRRVCFRYGLILINCTCVFPLHGFAYWSLLLLTWSKRHFTEQQAERWWAEHRPTLHQQYGILTGDSIIPSWTSQEKGYDFIIS